METNSTYKVSVIVPVYNAEEKLPTTIETVCAQDIGFENIELILVDDQSTDDSYNVAKKYAEKHKNICLYQSSENSGYPGRGRNIGLEHASAPYIMFLDNDDALFPNSCSSLYNAIVKQGTDCVKAPYFRNDELVDKFGAAGLAEGKYDFEDVFWYVMHDVWDGIYRADIIERTHLRFCENSLAEDDAFTMSYLTVADTVYYIKTPVLKHIIHGENLSFHIKERDWWRSRNYLAYGKAIDFVSENNVTEKFNRITSKNGVFVNIIELMLAQSGDLTKEEIRRYLVNWKKSFIYAYENKHYLHTLGAKIIFRDIADDDPNLATEHFLSIRDLYEQRNKEIRDIRASKTWKLSDRILHPAKLFGGGE